MVDRDIAGVGTRMLAQAIDLPLIVAVELGVVFIGGMLSAGSESLALVFMIVVGAVVPFVYFIVPEGRGRQTPGKRLFAFTSSRWTAGRSAGASR